MQASEAVGDVMSNRMVFSMTQKLLANSSGSCCDLDTAILFGRRTDEGRLVLHFPLVAQFGISDPSRYAASCEAFSAEAPAGTVSLHIFFLLSVCGILKGF